KQPFIYYMKKVKNNQYNIANGIEIMSNLIHNNRIIFNKDFRNLWDYLIASEKSIHTSNPLLTNKIKISFKQTEKLLKLYSPPKFDFFEEANKLTNNSLKQEYYDDNMKYSQIRYTLSIDEIINYVFTVKDILKSLLIEIKAKDILYQYLNETQIELFEDEINRFEEMAKLLEYVPQTKRKGYRFRNINPEKFRKLLSKTRLDNI
ncbi:MAG: hypothetical protein QCI00_08800, partial [Candidatus Thermoplasmatota archaeon]|nr:hypothetical protein [Candidatus Thermoplasmatota archaeon]